ncbi:hypothetical protein M422DRAFT_269858 [Sphaerobolus stellatus SS14]|uniref:Uncharacterized protein n=1 Tax=Sphaerobolus stellatus (strain SS14) TaxID=990650 RepID=A0A0C9UIQ7_SPHS4|nr:hypothetical protein M422DRAFT_269858 [Sphaerobolus stellatus SS14]
MTTTLPGTFPSSPKQPPRCTDSLSSSITKPKPTSPIIQSADDAKAARALLETPLSTLKAEDRLGPEERERRREERESELMDVGENDGEGRGACEFAGGLLTQAYKNQTDLETALTLTRSNLQLALANNEMFEDALKRTCASGKDVGWRRWSERDDLQRSNSLKDRLPSRSLDTTPSSSTPPSTTSRSRHPRTQRMPLQRIPLPRSSPSQPYSLFTSGPRTTSGSGSALPPPLPSPSQKKKLRTKAQELAAAKEQLEAKLESMSQALFEEDGLGRKPQNRRDRERAPHCRGPVGRAQRRDADSQLAFRIPYFLRMVDQLYERRGFNYSDTITFFPHARLMSNDLPWYGEWWQRHRLPKKSHPSGAGVEANNPI